MATHAQTRTPVTIISDSNITIDTLNVDKTTTVGNIVDNLPLQKSLSFSSFDQTNSTFEIFPLVKEGFEKFVMLFINGDIVPRLESMQGDGFYIDSAFDKLYILGEYTALINEQTDVTIFYTPA